VNFPEQTRKESRLSKEIYCNALELRSLRFPICTYPFILDKRISIIERGVNREIVKKLCKFLKLIQAHSCCILSVAYKKQKNESCSRA